MQQDSRTPLIEEPCELAAGGHDSSAQRRPVTWMSRLVWWPTRLADHEQSQKKHKYLRLSQQSATETAAQDRKQLGYLRSFLSPAQSSPPTPPHANQWFVFSKSPPFVRRGVGRRFLTTLGLLTLAVICVLLLIESLQVLEWNGFAKRQVGASLDLLQASRGNLLPTQANNKGSLLTRHNTTLSHPHWLVWTNKCHIPRLNAWDNSISEYVEYNKPLSCADAMRKEGIFDAMTYVDQNRLRFRDFAIKALAVKRQFCCYKKINRGSDDRAQLEYAEPCIRISLDGLEAPAPLIQVRCDIFNYTNVHSFIVHDYEEELVFAQIMSQNLLKDQYYNVIMVGVDTVSQLNGRRQFNKTLALLESDLYQVLDFVGYNKVGENTFPNLVPLLTGLTPEQLVETKCWLANSYSSVSQTGDDYLDNCKYLWSFFQELGYLTYFSEDWPFASTFNYLKMGFKNPPTTFYGRPFTLARSPLLLPHNDQSCHGCLYERPVVELDLGNLKNFVQVHQGRPLFAFHWVNCPMHDSLNGGSTVDSIFEKFFRDLRQYERERTFVIFLSDHGYRWNDFVSTRIGHYEASLPMLKVSVPSHFIQHHPDLYENLKSHQSALVTPFDLFHTIMDIRNLGASKKFVEPFTKKNVPLVRRKYLETTFLEPSKPPHKKDFLGELTSGLETKTTITQLQSLNGLNYKQQFSTLSLLDPHTSEQLDRSCDDAGIPDSYCVCMEFLPVPSDTPDVIGAAQYLVYVHIYDLLKDHFDKCHFLDLHSITSSDRYVFKQKQPLYDRFSAADDSDIRARLSKEDDDDYQILSYLTTAPPNSLANSSIPGDKKLPTTEYRITVSTKPGQALFHEVIRMYGNLDECRQKAEEVNKLNSTPTEIDTKRLAVLEMNKVCKYIIHSESLSRLNLYKDQSKCIIDQTEVKKVCYCRDIQLDS